MLYLISSLHLLGAFFLAKDAFGKEPFIQAVSYLAIFCLTFLISKYLAYRSKGFQITFSFFLLLIESIFFYQPPLSDDVNRYLWEGAILNHGINPYVHAPDSLINVIGDNDTELKKIHTGINHPDKTAIYGPLFLYFMAFLTYFHVSYFSYRLFITACALILFFVSIKLLKQKELEPRYALLFFLNPLVMVFAYGEGHNELLMLVFMALGFLLLKKKSLSLCLASLAVLIKPTAALFFIHFLRKKYLSSYFVLLILLLMLFPFLSDWKSMFSSLFYFGGELHFMGGLSLFFDHLPQRRLITLFIFLLLIGMAYTYSLSLERILFFGYFLFCLLSPTVHPWYLLPLLFFNQFIGSISAWFWSLLIVLTLPHYHHYLNTHQWSTPTWIPSLVYALLYPAILWDIFAFGMRSHYKKWPRLKHHPSISLIIPVFNEEANLKKNLIHFQEALDNHTGEKEILFVDGGSTDKTLDLLEEHPCISSRPGRGHQIKNGVAQSHGEIIFVAHADLSIDPMLIQKAIDAMLKDEHIVIGSFSMVYEKDKKLKFIQRLNDFRARTLGISFGDQVQFFRRDALTSIQGYPDIPLFEDVELSLKLKKQGKVVFLKNGGVVSNRRWQKKGYFNNAFRVIYLFHIYLIHRFFIGESVDYQKFYERYYTPKA